MGSVGSRLQLRKSVKIQHSDFEGKPEEEVLENKTSQALKQKKTQDSTQAESADAFPMHFGDKNKTGLKGERRQTRIAWQREGTSDNAPAKNSVKDMRIDEKDRAERILVLEAQVNQLRQEKDQLRTRLSEIGAVRLTDNNPNITDLSDANRPEKLMEQFAEIYDNKWMYAFECLMGTYELQEDTAVKELLRILQVIYTECLSRTRKHSERLKKAIARYLGMSQQKDELVIKETEKRLREYRGKNPDLNIIRIGKIIKKRLKGQLEDKVYQYMQVCTRVCWLMCIKDPQMHLHFGDSPRNNDSYDTNKDAHTPMDFDATQFVSYTRRGKYVEFVVWPAVYLFKDGPIMKKGVAQGSQEKPMTNEITVDYTNGGNYDNSVITIRDKNHVHNGATEDGDSAKAKHQKLDCLSNYSTCDTMLEKKGKWPKDINQSGVSGHIKMEYAMAKQHSSSFLRNQQQGRGTMEEKIREELGTQKEGNANLQHEVNDCTNNTVLNPDVKTAKFKDGEESSGNIYRKKQKRKKKRNVYSFKDKSSN